MIKISATEGVVMIQNTIELDAEQKKLNDNGIERLRAWGKDNHLNIMFVKSAGVVAIGKMLEKDVSDEDLHIEIVSLEQTGIKVIDVINALIEEQEEQRDEKTNHEIVLSNGLELGRNDVDSIKQLYCILKEKCGKKDDGYHTNVMLGFPAGVVEEMLKLFLKKYNK